MLSEAERVTLRWMVKANEPFGGTPGGGLFGPSLRVGTVIPECDDLVRAGLATRERDGYWITPAGRAALEKEEVADVG